MESEVEANKGRRDHGTMIASGLQKNLKSNGSISRKENRYARFKTGRKDLKVKIRVGNDCGLVTYKNSKVERDSEKAKAVETRCVRIKVHRFKKIGEGRRHMIGWVGNKINRQLIYWKSKIR